MMVGLRNDVINRQKKKVYSKKIGLGPYYYGL
jgi:hypothetical protein